MVEEARVRAYLADMPTDRVSPACIAEQIELANTIVESEKSDEATDEQVEDAKLAQAGYLTYVAYATEVERSTGSVPEPVVAHLARLEIIADKMLAYVKHGAETPQVPYLAQLTESAMGIVEGDIT